MYFIHTKHDRVSRRGKTYLYHQVLHARFLIGGGGEGAVAVNKNLALTGKAEPSDLPGIHLYLQYMQIYRILYTFEKNILIG